MKRVFLVFTIFTTLILSASTISGAQESRSINKNSCPISLPNGTIEGKLKNGLSYIVLNNPNPSNKMEIRLIVKIGANQEEESQRGAAHFLEHMAFAGTKHFPNRGIIEYFESLGMKYGRDINAVTGYDRTIYILSIPLEKNSKDITRQSIKILKDWLCNISFEEERTKRERGVILEELRGYDIGDDLYDLKIGSNRFSKRMPLGSIEDITSISREKLLEFYNTWYSPSVVTVMIIGDINSKEIEKEIKSTLSNIKSKDLKGQLTYPLEYNKGITIKEVRDSLCTSSTLEIMIPHPCTISKCLNSTCKQEMGKILIKLLYQRFKIQNIKSYFFNNWYLSDKEHFGFTISEKNKKEILNTLSNASCELAQIRQNGFQQEELDAVLSKFIQEYNNLPDTKTSANLCDDLSDYVISNDIHISSKSQKDSIIKMLQAIPASEYLNLLNTWLSHMQNTILVAYRNNNPTDTPLTEAEIKSAWNIGKQSDFKKFTFKLESDESIKNNTSIPCLEASKEFNQSYIKTQKEYKNLGIKEISLTNGITLILKKTEDPDKKIQLSSFTPGGLAWISADKHYLLEGVAAYMDMNGIKDADYAQLQDYLYKNKIYTNNAIESHWNGYLGTAPTDKHKQLFNLIYEQSFYPHLNYQEFDEIKAEELAGFGSESVLDKMLKRTSSRLLREKLDQLLGNSISNATRDKTKDDIINLNLDSLAAFHKELQSITENKTFIICGNFNCDSIIHSFVSVFGPLTNKNINSNSNLQAPKFTLPTNSYKEGFDGINPNQTVFDLIYFGNYQGGLKNTLKLKIIRDILQNRLLSVLRERETIVYSPYISLFYSGQPHNIYYFDINASIDSSNSKKIKTLIEQIIKDLYKTPIKEQELNAIKRSFILTKKEHLTPDASNIWRNVLTTLLKNGESLDDFNNYEDIMNSISTNDISLAIKQYINNNKHLLLHLGEFKE